jgi:hypothetical protein
MHRADPRERSRWTCRSTPGARLSRCAAEAAGRTLDAAVFFGTNKPSSWPSDITTAAVAAGNTVNRATNNAAAGGIAQDISDVMATVEADGFDVNGIVAEPRLSRALPRRARHARASRSWMSRPATSSTSR